MTLASKWRSAPLLLAVVALGLLAPPALGMPPRAVAAAPAMTCHAMAPPGASAHPAPADASQRARAPLGSPPAPSSGCAIHCATAAHTASAAPAPLAPAVLSLHAPRDPIPAAPAAARRTATPPARDRIPPGRATVLRL